MKKVKVAIGFKSGNNFHITVDSLHIKKSTVNSGGIESIRWVGGPRLLYMNLSEVEYVIEQEG